jgi:hypothetical protein
VSAAPSKSGGEKDMPIDILGGFFPFFEAALRSALGASGSDYVIIILRAVLGAFGVHT